MLLKCLGGLIILVGICTLSIVLFDNRLISLFWAIFMSGVSTGTFGCVMLGFYALKLKPVNKYCIMLKETELGIKDVTRQKFIRFNEEITTKDGVEYYSMVTEVYAGKLGIQESERQILIERDKPKPDLKEGDWVKLVTNGNILLEYKTM